MKNVKRLVTYITQIVTVSALFCGPLVSLVYAADNVAPDQCRAALLDPVEIELFEKDFLLVNGVAVTGDFIYKLEMVLHDLGLDARELMRLQQGQSVLSLAEGISGLLPHLLEQGIKVRGLDLWYHANEFPVNYTGKLMREYMRNYGDHLIQGNARQIPLEDESVDLVVSHMLVNNIEADEQKDIVKEALRVVKKGGEVRLFGFNEDDIAQITKFLNANYRGKISFRYEQKKWDYIFRGRRNDHEAVLLTVYKMQKGESSVLQ